MIERQMLANEAAHEQFIAENRRLLTAQILMNGAMQKMNGAMQRMAEGMVSLESKMEETMGKLNALIDTVDGIIRRPSSVPARYAAARNRRWQWPGAAAFPRL